MATTVTVGNQTYKRRNPVAVWIGLPLLTLGIYYFVWWYKINDEARRFLGDPAIRPGVSVLAVSVGTLVIVPHFVSTYSTTNRGARMQERAGWRGSVANPWIAILLTVVFATHRLYLQMQLNDIWDGYLRGTADPTPLRQPPVSPPPGLPPPVAAPPSGPPTVA